MGIARRTPVRLLPVAVWNFESFLLGGIWGWGLEFEEVWGLWGPGWITEHSRVFGPRVTGFLRILCSGASSNWCCLGSKSKSGVLLKVSIRV